MNVVINSLPRPRRKNTQEQAAALLRKCEEIAKKYGGLVEDGMIWSPNANVAWGIRVKRGRVQITHQVTDRVVCSGNDEKIVAHFYEKYLFCPRPSEDVE